MAQLPTLSPVIGVNAYYLTAYAAFGTLPNGESGTGAVDRVLDAAQRLGLGVVRTWAFNTGLPLRSGLYDEEQQAALDYVIAAAGRRGLKLVLALGNFWHHYFGLEDWLAMAEGSAAGKNVADFYSKHIAIMTGRASSISGVVRKDDPAILGWDVFNEPRCPGCDPAAAAARDSFLSSMAAARDFFLSSMAAARDFFLSSMAAARDFFLSSMAAARDFFLSSMAAARDSFLSSMAAARDFFLSSMAAARDFFLSSMAAARDSFLSSMAAALKAAAPGQLTFSGTEGYFGSGDAHVS
ncbi:hypothetical protein OEZ85_002983 [Tetradesmus obliquus]|uniref:mannan endo-1,4-beta-mannosidase n=1 Tax=Tetradesmus obliquus TaxID=3088 RepID=A0ABY8TZ75_TETOB|nr:hypothetical protein OEZ85_002983 [Tetradesmus obliquus]